MKNKYKVVILIILLATLFFIVFYPLNPTIVPGFIHDIKCKLHLRECHSYMQFNEKELNEFIKSYENTPKYNPTNKDTK